MVGEQRSDAAAWVGRELGCRSIAWTDKDAILYALSLGIEADQLDLVFERDLQVLPTFALTLAQWAPDALGARGAWDTASAVHGSQTLAMHRRLPPEGCTDITASVEAVWDKGSAAVFDVAAHCEYFTATWSIFAPGIGGFGGDRGPGRPEAVVGEPDLVGRFPIAPNAAALYRLTGDRHHIHIDPAAAAAIGQPRPILHGLSTLGHAAVQIARMRGCHPASLIEMEGRFSSAVFPGETVSIQLWQGGAFVVGTDRGRAIDGGRAVYASEVQEYGR
ncbi:MaoC/PaaZ C-terminal domain-containing protein [Gordonia sp. LSe1-13]|uniref:MaoC/PaaZ C-terminal domain-containing protein n=1 Tax=Gordonia sesuvii TaxID=3116777 RepID=A0ABU7M9B8_9ACTN|nr:MaoC/PaaZ C-terminal domain-containing protein [Gordonia sp. LSe1-13]